MSDEDDTPLSESFNLEAGEALGKAGEELAARNRTRLLAFAKKTAREISRERLGGELTMDDVQRRLLRIIPGYHPDMLGNAAGSTFRGKGWKMVGYKKSVRISNHARIVRVWKLVDHATTVQATFQL